MQARSTSWSSAELTSHSQWIRALALRLVRDAAQADDLVQETFLAALQRRPERERSLRPWLGRVLRNQAALWRRGEARRHEREHDRTTSEALPSSAELLERAELHAAVVQALTRLREPYRSVVLLRYYEGFEPSEIARRQGVPAATVRSQLKRGLDELRSEMDERFEGDRRHWALAAVPLAAKAHVPATVFGMAVTVAAAAVVVGLATVWVVAPTRGGAAVRGIETQAAAPGLANPADPPTLAYAGGEFRSPIVETLPVQSPQEAPITGILRDRETGAPVPHYALDLTDAEGEVEVIWTDAEGRFESERSYAADDYILGYIDHPEYDKVTFDSGGSASMRRSIGVSLRWDPEQAPLELETSLGPTYRLAITAAFPWESSPLQGSLQSMHPAMWESRPGNGAERAPVRSAPLTGHDGPWLRFWCLYRSLRTDRPWLLRVETADGLWAGETTVPASEQGVSEPVALTLEPRARLELALLSVGPLRSPVVTLEAVSDGTRRAMFASGETLRGNGMNESGFELSALPAGDYDLFLRSEGAEHVQATVSLVAGEVTRRELEVVGGVAIAHISGELRSQSGQYREQMILRLEGAGSSFTQRPQWAEHDGQWVAPFEFVNLSAAEYNLRLSSERSNYRWNPYPLTVSPPTEGLILTCRDDEAVSEVEIRVTRAGTDEGPCVDELIVEGCPHPWTSMGSSGGEDVPARSFYKNVPLDAAVNWFAWAEGCAPQWGDESALVSEGDVRVIDVALEPGWGGRLWATSTSPAAPLAGVEVLLDGQSAGVTDEQGKLILVRPTAPARIDLVLEGHHFEGGDYDAESGKLTGSFGRHFVRFRPSDE